MSFGRLVDVRIPVLGLEVEPGSAASGYVSNVEGVFIRFRDTMMMMQRGHDPDIDASEDLKNTPDSNRVRTGTVGRRDRD